MSESMLCTALRNFVASYPRLVPLSMALYHTYFIRGQECKWWFRRLKLSLSVISINQSIHFYTANIPGKARLSGMTAESVFNSKISEAVPWHQWAVWFASVYREKARSKRCVFRCFFKVATEMTQWENIGRLSGERASSRPHHSSRPD